MEKIEMFDNDFSRMDFEEVYERVSRMRRALERKYRPLELDVEHQTAKFKGSSADAYITTLDSCTCPDWAINGKDITKPCKHMYRLAHELHLCDLQELIASAEIKDKKLQKEATEILHLFDKYFEFMPVKLLEEKTDRLIQIKKEVSN